jgi:hypothetical protein
MNLWISYKLVICPAERPPSSQWIYSKRNVTDFPTYSKIFTEQSGCLQPSQPTYWTLHNSLRYPRLPGGGGGGLRQQLQIPSYWAQTAQHAFHAAIFRLSQLSATCFKTDKNMNSEGAFWFLEKNLLPSRIETQIVQSTA